MCGHRAAPVREAETGAKGKQVTRVGEKRQRGVGVHGTEKTKDKLEAAPVITDQIIYGN